MKRIHKFAVSYILLAGLVVTSGCSGMSTRDKNTAIGAGVGGVAGAVLTGGGTLGTIGGAAIGGVIGNQIDKDKK
ncbi:MAG: glycine zipper 2TM domain-containing protein [Methylotenera sp.]|nr:glycine zipper 2TM domain-containing protein [Methylotenera sp.]